MFRPLLRFAEWLGHTLFAANDAVWDTLLPLWERFLERVFTRAPVPDRPGPLAWPQPFHPPQHLRYPEGTVVFGEVSPGLHFIWAWRLYGRGCSPLVTAYPPPLPSKVTDPHTGVTFAVGPAWGTHYLSSDPTYWISEAVLLAGELPKGDAAYLASRFRAENLSTPGPFAFTYGDIQSWYMLQLLADPPPQPTWRGFLRP